MSVRFAILVVGVAACAHRGPSDWRPPSTINAVVIDGDYIIRPEADGGSSVIARVSLDDKVGFGAVVLPGVAPTAARKSPSLVVAQARAWQALSIALAATPARAYEAAWHGMALLPPCRDPYIVSSIPQLTPDDPHAALDDTFWIRRELVQRLGCLQPKRSVETADLVALDSDLVIRRERDGAIGVIAVVSFGGVVGAGYMRILRGPFERASTSSFTDIARLRAWQTVVAMLADKPELAYAAGMQATHVIAGCGVTENIRLRLHVETRRDEPDGLASANEMMRAALARDITSCVRKLHGHVL